MSVSSADGDAQRNADAIQVSPVDDQRTTSLTESAIGPIVDAPAPAEDPSGDATATRRTWPVTIGESWKSVLLLSLLFLVLSVSLSVISQLRDDRYSLLDEATHADYAYKAATFSWPRIGSPMSQAILSDWSCRRQVNLGERTLPACGTIDNNQKYPQSGKNYNMFHPPLYYAVTGLAARAIDAVIPGWHFVPIVRTLGAVWLAAGMIALFLTLRYWRVGRSISVAAGLLLLAVPGLVHAARIATNDAPAALCGVAAVFVLGRVLMHRNTGWILPTVLSVLASATKTLNGLPLVAAGLVLGVMGLVSWRRKTLRSGWPLIRLGLGIGGGAALVYVVWDRLQAAMKLPGAVPRARKLPTSPQFNGTPVDTWLSEIFNGFGMTRSYYLHPGQNSLTLKGWVAVLTLLIAASSLIVVVLYAKGTAARILGWTLMVGSVLYPLMTEVKYFQGTRGNGVFVNLTTRYGLSFISVAVAALALVVAARPAFRRFWLALSGVGLVIITASILGWLTNV